MNRFTLDRRHMLGGAGMISGLLAANPTLAASPQNKGFRFEGSWDNFVKNYEAPEWFRDAKLGLWAHWGPQCEPGASDWYARDMYIQGTSAYNSHVKNYGHPSKFGFMDVINSWKADRFDPEGLMKLYKDAGAKYFMAMVNHHDNFDIYNSRYNNWNVMRVGPKRDLMAMWEKAARNQGMKFGISNHSSQAWHWTQVAYSYDAEGPMKGVRYDGATRRLQDGKGQWWEGLDPQELYSAPVQMAPDGIKNIKDMQEWQRMVTGPWASPMKLNPAFGYQWALRTIDSIDQYDPDIIYFDDGWLPMGQLGLDLTARYYNMSVARHGKVQVAVTGKALPEHMRKGIVESVERGFSDDIRPHAWQTCTCIGHWHYDKGLYERKGYKSPKDVVQRLLDIVSKNGTLLLSIPLPGHGEIDSEARKVVEGLGAWMKVNAEGIHGSRPWRRFGEGPTERKAGQFNEDAAKPFTSEDIRLTTKGGKLYAYAMDWPKTNKLLIKTLKPSDGKIDSVKILGTGQPIKFKHTDAGLEIEVQDSRPSLTPSYVITGSIAKV